jgi:thiol-disulfide isomerase/thioredoxin
MFTRKILILFLLQAASLMIFAQDTYQLTFHIEGLPVAKVSLIFYYGDQQIRKDTAVTDVAGKAIFVMNDQSQEGMYRLERDKEKGLDFLFNKEDIDIITGHEFGLESITVKKSQENSIFFDYYRHKRDLETRIEVLKGFLTYYPPVDSFYFEAATYKERLSEEYRSYLDSLLTNFQDKLVTRVIRLDQLPEIRPGDLPPAEVAKFRGSYFKSIDLKDTLNLNTPLLPAKIVSYLALYISPGASRDKQEQSFIEAVDSLMKFTEGSPKVREMVANYLINGFQTYGFETVLTYLVEHYVIGQSCVSDQQEEKLKIRIEGFKKLAIGSIAPDFKAIDSRGDSIRMSDNRGKPTLLIFWAGNCPHCEAIMPEIKILNTQYTDKVRFIGVSVDQDGTIWRTALEKDDLPWANIAELKGWDGKIVQDYYVYATPTFVLVDPAMRIKSKPTGLAELKDALLK